MTDATDNAALLTRSASRLCLEGKPTESLADWATTQKVIDFGAARARLRPPETFVKSLTRTLANIDAVFASRKAPTDG
jgi:hypothetical protein